MPLDWESSHDSIHDIAAYQSVHVCNRWAPSPITAWSHGAKEKQRTSENKDKMQHRSSLSDTGNKTVPVRTSTDLSPLLPLTDVLYKALRDDLQSLATTLTLSSPFKMWTNCNHNIFFNQGRSTPTCVSLNKKHTSVPWKCQYDSPTLTTKSWGFTCR